MWVIEDRGPYNHRDNSPYSSPTPRIQSSYSKCCPISSTSPVTCRHHTLPSRICRAVTLPASSPNCLLSIAAICSGLLPAFRSLSSAPYNLFSKLIASLSNGDCAILPSFRVGLGRALKGTFPGARSGAFSTVGWVLYPNLASLLYLFTKYRTRSSLTPNLRAISGLLTP